MAQQRIIIIGATSAIAHHCARHWINNASTVLLVGRDNERLSAVADDLRVRGPQADITTAILDFGDPDAIQAVVADYACDAAIDIALVAHGDLPDQFACQDDLAASASALTLNGISPALFMEALVKHMAAAGAGRLAVIGSVAGDRGRKSNYVYGAAKGMLERYTQGLQHRTAGSGLYICLVKPGPTLTPMTAHLLDDGPGLAPVEDVAGAIVRGMQKGKPVIYAPGKWAIIMLAIKHLPRFIFNKLDI
jgi:decaprenylphospho-beta-D-erythro-pentofuranosid-2-ulose 2-reductase